MKKQYIYAGLAIFFWSTLATTAKLLLAGFNNFQVLWMSSFFAAISLLIANGVTGKLRLLKTYGIRDFLTLCLHGMLGIFLYHVFYYAGAQRLPASQAFVINYLWPILSIVFAGLILREPLSGRKLLAVFISFGGVAVVTGGALADFRAEMALGVFFCMMGAVSYGLFTALSRTKDYDQWVAMMLHFGMTFLMTTLILWVKKDLFLPDALQLAGFGWNGVFTMAIPNVMWVLALAKGNTAKISNLAYATPVLSLVWARVILKEPLGISCVLGLLLILLGILVQLREKKGQVQI